MNLDDYLRTIFALLFVLGLIGLIYLLARQYAVRRYGAGALRGGLGARLAVVEIRPLDARRRLVLVRRDDVEHLLLLGTERDSVIETGIPAPAPSRSAPADAAAGPVPPSRSFGATLAGAAQREPRL